MSQTYKNWNTFEVSCHIDNTPHLRKAKEFLLKEVAADKHCRAIGPNLVSAFIADHGICEEVDTPTGEIHFMELAIEWTREMEEMRHSANFLW